MGTIPDALAQLQRLRGGSKNGKPMRLVRAARHSKFPECQTCQERRKAYLKVACDSRADPEVVAQAAQAMEVGL
jgi:hypothetical protein|tara:strand:- start:3 stop:224 length:222 start_codon:yes stop_codon:yes gene_type:complete